MTATPIHHPVCPARDGGGRCVCQLTLAELAARVDANRRDALARRSLNTAQDPGREPVSPPPGPAENGRAELAAARAARAELADRVSLWVAVACLSFLFAGLFVGWWS